MTDTTWYHGGGAGLKVGDWILPTRVTGKVAAGEFLSKRLGVPHTPPRDVVFVTTSLDNAEIYAGMHKNPAVYRVQPSGPVEGLVSGICASDPSLGKCARARVVGVLELPPAVITMLRGSNGLRGLGEWFASR